MILAGLDISKSATGWAVFDGSEWQSGVWKCPVKRPADLENGSIQAAYTGEVADWLANAITAFLAANRPDRVGIEQPIPGNSSRMRPGNPSKGFEMGEEIAPAIAMGGTSFEVTHFLHGLCVIACRCCVRLNCAPLYVASQTWRSTVKIGRAPKQDVIKNKVVTLSSAQRRAWYKTAAKAVCARRGIKVTNPDEAEAVCIALHMEEMAHRQAASAGLFDRSVA